MNTRVIRLLGNNGFTLVDADVFDAVRNKTWGMAGNGYIATRPWDSVAKKRRGVYLHRLVNGTPKGMYTDHIDGNKRNNTRSNLRSCTNSQNAMNKSPSTKLKASRFKGVCRSLDKWRAEITLNYTNHYLGSFDTEADAARAYNVAASKLFGRFAKLNLV